MMADNPLADKSRAQIGATAATCLYDCNADEVDTMFVDGFAPSAGGYVPNHRTQDLRELVDERMGDEWEVQISHEVDDLNETMVEVVKADEW